MTFRSISVTATEEYPHDTKRFIDRNELRARSSETTQSSMEAEIASHNITFDPKKTASENEVVSSQNGSRIVINPNSPSRYGPGE